VRCEGGRGTRTRARSRKNLNSLSSRSARHTICSMSTKTTQTADSDVHEQELADQLGAVNINGGVSVGGGNDDVRLLYFLSPHADLFFSPPPLVLDHDKQQEGAIDLQGADEQQQAYAPPQGWQQVDMMQMVATIIFTER